MKWKNAAALLLFGIVAIGIGDASAADDGFGAPPGVFRRIRDQVADTITTRIVKLENKCVDRAVAGYEGLPTKLCQYRRNGQRAKMIVLNPDRTQLARWVLFTCQGFDIGGSSSNENFLRQCGSALLKQIKRESGGQFFVAGILIEAGGFYVVRDGVVVSVSGIENGTHGQLSDTTIEKAMVDPLIGWSNYSRFEHTTYDDYARFGRETDANGKLIDDSNLTFPALVAQRFRNSWSKDINSLLRAWSCANPTKIKATAACVEVPSNAPGAARKQP